MSDDPIHNHPDMAWDMALPTGMTLRDWFAGQAISALIRMQMPSPMVAEHAYKIADAMIAERSKP